MNSVYRVAGIITLALIAFLLVESCSGIINSDDYEIDKLKATPTLSLPLAHGDLLMQDILDKSDIANVKVYPDGLIYVEYSQTLKTQGIRDVITFPNRSFIKTVPVPPATLPARTTAVNYTTLTTNEDFNFSPERLTEMKFKNASVRVSVSFIPANPGSSVFDVQLRLPTFKLNNIELQRRVSAPSTTTFSLQDYVATLNNNSFPLEIIVIEKAHASPVVISGGTLARVQLDFVGIDFQYVRGFFGDRSVTNIPSETISFDAFGKALSKANVSFADPKISISVSNDYGIPTRINFSPLEGRKKSGAKLPVTLNPVSPVAINQPSQLGQSATTNISVANTKQLVDFVPDEFFYQVTARINQGLTSGNNFCADTSKVRVNVKAEVPLYGRASGIIMTDTFKLDLEDIQNTEIESGALLAKISNQLPLDANIQLYLANDQFIIYDSLLTTAQTAIVKSSSVNAQGELQTPGTTDLLIEINKAKLDKLLDAEKLIVKARLNTSKNAQGNPVDVKFKSTYKMNVVFGLKVKLKLEVDL